LSKVGTFATIVVTAVITAAITSAFWLVAFNRGPVPVSAPPEGGAAPVARSETLSLGPTGLAIPVLGVSPRDLADTYTQARAGGTRVHDAIDIIAPHGRQVVAAAPGTVEKLFFSKGGGGITAYVRSPDRQYIFYYAHLQDYAPGLKEGQVLKQGDPIGTVGSSGNASPAGPHLHFAIHRMAEGDKWHGGTPVNPYPLLVDPRR
jgi:murein DD-endopeptidase MepM/ murein hydrolase activator NlpD